MLCRFNLTAGTGAVGVFSGGFRRAMKRKTTYLRNYLARECKETAGTTTAVGRRINTS